MNKRAGLGACVGHPYHFFSWIDFTYKGIPNPRRFFSPSSQHIRLFILGPHHELHSSPGIAESTTLQVWWSRQVAGVPLCPYSILEQPCQDLPPLDRVSIACVMQPTINPPACEWISILTLHV